MIEGLKGRDWVFLNMGVEHKSSLGLGRLYLEGRARQRGLAASSLNLAGKPLSQHLSSLVASLPLDCVVGLSTLAGAPTGRAVQVARCLRDSRPDVCIVWGGPLCSFYSTQIARSGLADVVVVGEGEPFIDAVAGDEESRARLKQVGPCMVVRTQMCKDLDTLPILPMVLDNRSPTFTYNRFGRVTTAYEIQITRGCWGMCRFCYVGGTQYRQRSELHLAEELKVIPQEVEYVRFIDDTFPLGPRIVDTIERWARSRSHIEFFCELRVEQAVNRRLIERLAKIGLREVFIGLESGSESERERLGKPLAQSDLQEAISCLRAFGVRSFVGFVLNTPGQTSDDLASTVRTARNLGADGYYPTFFQPYPRLPASPERDESLRDVEEQEWLRLSENITAGIEDDALLSAFVRIKLRSRAPTTLPGDCDLCSVVRPNRLSTPLGLVDLLAGLSSTIHERCTHCLIMGLRIIENRLTNCSAYDEENLWHAIRVQSKADDYHVRAAALWLAYRVVRTGNASESALSWARGISNDLCQDRHTFPREIARRLRQAASASCRVE